MCVHADPGKSTKSENLPLREEGGERLRKGRPLGQWLTGVIKENCSRGVTWWWLEGEAIPHASWQELKNGIEPGSTEGVPA